MKHFILLVLFAGFSALSLSAQNIAPSPAGKTIQTVGLTEITVEYSRPGLKGRAALSDGSALAPLGKLWRTGANAATKITFDKDVKVGGQAVAAGSYAILTIPGASEWTVNLYPYEAGSWRSYSEAKPAVSAKAGAATMDSPIETFMITFDEIKDDSAVLIMGWSNVVAGLPIMVNN